MGPDLEHPFPLPPSAFHMLPHVLTTVAEIRAALLPYRRAGKRIGLVPTMGALHEGHLSLVRASKAECDLTVVWIYVNPSQFGPHEDLAKYPRTLQADLEKLAACNAEFVMAPAMPRSIGPAMPHGLKSAPLPSRWKAAAVRDTFAAWRRSY